MSASAAARRRIEAAHRYGAIYRGGLASHHPMAIAALDAMGASETDLDLFEAHYLPQLEPMPSAVVTSVATLTNSSVLRQASQK